MIFEKIKSGNISEKEVIDALKQAKESTHSAEYKFNFAFGVIEAIEDCVDSISTKWESDSQYNYLGNNFLGYEEIDEYRVELVEMQLLIIIKTRFAYESRQYTIITVYKQV